MVSKRIINICKDLYERHYITPASGNVSALVDDNTILITPSRYRKHSLTEKDLCKIDLNGNPLCTAHSPSSEYRIHCAIYKKRPDIKAIVHAHPPYAIVCSLATITFEYPILPETALFLGSIPTVPYAPPGSEELVKAIIPYLPEHNALILKRHGVITLGSNLEEAFDRLEEVEFASHIAYLLSLKGRVPVLGRSQLLKLVDYVKKQGFPVPEFAMKILFRILAK